MRFAQGDNLASVFETLDQQDNSPKWKFRRWYMNSTAPVRLQNGLARHDEQGMASFRMASVEWRAS
jgi:hypothetical protein